MAAAAEDTALRAAKEGLTHEAFLLELARIERATKASRRIERLPRQSELLPAKNFRTLTLERFAPATRMQIERLRSGSFLKDATQTARNITAAPKWRPRCRGAIRSSGDPVR